MRVTQLKVADQWLQQQDVLLQGVLLHKELSEYLLLLYSEKSVDSSVQYFPLFDFLSVCY